MFNQDQDYLSICLTEQSIKIAQVKSSGAVVKVVRRDVTGVSGDALTGELRVALSGFNAKKSHVLCVIPASVATTKNIEVPSVDPEEIKSIINLQAARHTPFSRDEILVGHINLGSYQANFTKVLLVIVNRNVVKERLRVFEAAGLSVHKVVFEPEGTARFYAKALGVKRESAPVGIIDVGAQSTTFIIESRGTAAACRSIPIGISALSRQGAEARDKLINEIKTSLDAYKDEDIDRLPAYFILTSGQSIVKDLQPSLASAVGTPVQVTPFADHLKAGGGVRKKLDADFSDDTMADVMGPGATASRAEVNLIPEEILMKRNVEEQSKEAMVAGVLAVAVLILVGLILGSKNYFKETFLKKNLQAKYAGQRKEVADLQEELRRNTMVKNLLDSRLSSLQVLRGLYAVIPNDIYLNTVTQAEDGTVTVSGIAETTSRVYAFVSSLSESKFFDGVKTKATSGKKDRGKDLIAFEIEFVLSANVPEGNDFKLNDKTLKTPPQPAEGAKGT